MSQTHITSDRESDTRTSPSTPRWVKVLGFITLAFVLLVGIILLVGNGEHGPSRHMPPTNVTAEQTQSANEHMSSMGHGR